MLKKQMALIGILWFCICLVGCSLMSSSDKKVSDLEFEISQSEELPEEVLTMIEERKAQPFQMAYSNENNTYIILGYGEQPTSGYSIQVNDVYQGENSIWVDTNLMGPQKSKVVDESPSYPYVIIKIVVTDQTIRFKN